MLSIIIPNLAWILFLSGASIGGIGAGIAWTAQGAYYSRNAQLYAELADTSLTKANSDFAAIFATSYLGFESFSKVSL